MLVKSLCSSCLFSITWVGMVVDVGWLQLQESVKLRRAGVVVVVIGSGIVIDVITVVQHGVNE